MLHHNNPCPASTARAGATYSSPEVLNQYDAARITQDTLTIHAGDAGAHVLIVEMAASSA